jgi:hypothetical protein
MNFSDLQPGDLFTLRPLIGMPWRDQTLYRKATDRTYHRADKVLSIFTVRSAMTPITPESSDAVAKAPQLSELAEANSELAKLLAHEDANYDALANEDEAEALKRWSDSQRGELR